LAAFADKFMFPDAEMRPTDAEDSSGDVAHQRFEDEDATPAAQV
jgi:hypothetical protein